MPSQYHSTFEIKIFRSLAEISSEQWKLIIGDSFPFANYEYLRALELGNCVGSQAGWLPLYITVWQNEQLHGATYLYLKDNSYGEYIFDWEWVNAFYNHGIRYYPKLVSAVPFTPATGNKLLLREDTDRNQVAQLLLESALELNQKQRSSSLHYLFIQPEEISWFDAQGFAIRHTYQFHWKNREYTTFDDFLSSLKRKKRKEILRERRQVNESGVEIYQFSGDAIQTEHCEAMYDFYLSTIMKKGAIPYLSHEFYLQIFQSMKEHLLIVLAKYAGKWVAGTINYFKGDCFYGRYWGCLEDFKHLHFELCYYQTIEFVIARRMKLLEAGAQGPHKLQRGFLPEYTYSAHWIENSQFREAITHALHREKKILDMHIMNSQTHFPYKEEWNPQ